MGAALLLALALTGLPNLTYISDPMQLAGGILIFLFASVLLVSIKAKKRIIFSCILLIELLILSILAAMPLHTYYTGQDIILKTLPINQEDRYSFDRGHVPTDYGIFKSSPNLNGYHAGDDVYLILEKQKEGYWAVEQITKSRPKSERSTLILTTTVIKDSEKPGRLSLVKFRFVDIPRDLMSDSKEKAPYLVTLKIGNFGTLILSVKEYVKRN